MKLTLKDKDFLERLRKLMESKELSIELKQDGIKRLVLRQNYGDKIEYRVRDDPAMGQVEIPEAHEQDLPARIRDGLLG